MSEYREISIFVAHAFSPVNKVYELDSFRKSIYVLIENVRNHLRTTLAGFNLKPIIELNEFTERISPQIDQQLGNCHFAIVDISDNNANVMYELGQLNARGIPNVIIKSRKSELPIPLDISSKLIFFYNDIKDIESMLVENISHQFKTILNAKSLPSEFIRKIWFPQNVSYLHVVCGPELQKTEFASRSSSNYIFMDNLEDKDALVEILMLLSKYYQRARLIRYSSDNLPQGILETDLVLIGGPGEPAGPGNVACRQMMDLVKTRISYSDDAEIMYFEGREYRATFDSQGYVLKDYGYFAKFSNPLNPESKVVLLNGIHTYGTLGASIAFSDHPSAQINVQNVLSKFLITEDSDVDFECFFEVNVLPGGGVSCPQVRPENIYQVNK